MEILDLQMVVAIAETGSLSGAATRLQIGQPALSMRVKHLEEELGQPLVTRGRRGVQLTPAGEKLLEGAQRALAVLQGTREQVRHSRTRPQIRLGAVPSVASYFLPEVIERLIPEVDVSVDSGDGPDLVRKLVQDDLEAAIIVSGVVPPGFTESLICRIAIIPVTTPGRGLEGRPIGIDQLSGQGIAFWPFSAEAQDLNERLVTVLGPLSGVVKVCPVEMSRAFALRDYVAFVPEMVVTSELAEGRLVRLEIPELPAYFWDLKLVHRERKYLAPGVARLREALGLPS